MINERTKDAGDVAISDQSTFNVGFRFSHAFTNF